MDSVSRFVIWICSKFNREQIERIVLELQEILANRNPEVKPKDDFKKNIQTTGTSMQIHFDLSIKNHQKNLLNPLTTGKNALKNFCKLTTALSNPYNIAMTIFKFLKKSPVRIVRHLHSIFITTTANAASSFAVKSVMPFSKQVNNSENPKPNIGALIAIMLSTAGNNKNFAPSTNVTTIDVLLTSKP